MAPICVMKVRPKLFELIYDANFTDFLLIPQYEWPFS